MELLDLSKVVERDTIRLNDGKPYEIRNPNEFGITEYARLSLLQEKARALEAEATAKGKLTAKKEQELLELLGETTRLLIPKITGPLLAKLSKAQREQIVLVWMGRHMTADGDESGESASRRSGAPSSRGSKRSTAATRGRGSRSRSGS